MQSQMTSQMQSQMTGMPGPYGSNMMGMGSNYAPSMVQQGMPPNYAPSMAVRLVPSRAVYLVHLALHSRLGKKLCVAWVLRWCLRASLHTRVASTLHGDGAAVPPLLVLHAMSLAVFCPACLACSYRVQNSWCGYCLLGCSC